MHTIYLKTHNVTGLKYLGYTRQSDPHKYQGSGKRWKKHIKKHGYDVTTEVIYQGDYWMVALVTAMECNAKWLPKDNPAFANLIDEELDGSTPDSIARRASKAVGRRHSSEWNENISKSMKGKVPPPHVLSACVAASTGRVHSDNERAKRSVSLKGIKRGPMSEERKLAIRATMAAKWQDPEYVAMQMSKRGKKNVCAI